MRLGKRLYSLLIFLGVSILGGGLLAGLVIPAVSMASNTGRDAAASLESLPADFPTTPAAERTRVELADGTFLTYFYEENRVVEKLENIAPIMQQAQVAIEDHRFFDHGAIDLTGTMRALLSTSQGVTQGGSSITQQYVRLLQLQLADATNDSTARLAATENTLSRKIREMRFAMALEKKLTKQEILEGYLNLSYYGDGAYGVAAAARHYFGVSASKLNLAQAAMLAGLVRNPVLNNPVKNPLLAEERRNDVIDRMLQLSKDPDSGMFGLITDEEAAAAKAEKFDQSKVTKNTLNCANSKYPFVCDYAKRVLLTQSSQLGATEAERKDYLFRGGLTIKLTVDPKIQKQSEATVADYLDPRDPAISVITMIQPSTGNILAMAQSRPKWGDKLKKGTTNFNYAASYAMGGTEGFQGGSTFKAFVAAAALEQGMGAYGTYKADRQVKMTGKVFKSCDGPFTQTNKWEPVGGAGGRSINMFQGVTGSVNTYFAQLIQAVGVCESVTMATRLGLEMGRPTPQNPNIMSYDTSPAFTLGAVEVTPLSLVSAYSTFANRGKHCEPNIIASITTSTGKEIKPPETKCEQVISKDVADAINKIFQGPMNAGTARPAKIYGVQMAGKTGTVDGNKAVWTIGYTPELAGGAVISYDSSPEWASFWNPKKKNINYAHMKYSGRTILARSGSQAGGMLLKPAFAYALKHLEDYKGTKFKEPPESILRGEQVSVPSCSGLSVNRCLKKLQDAGFPAYTIKVNSDAAKGTLVGTQPSGKAPKGSGIAVQVSKGPKKGSEAWCKLDGNEGREECLKYLPPPVCAEGEVLYPDPPPGVCLPAEQQPQGNQGGGGGRGRR
ncbi:MAG: transglycosylase domain-containing protein [Propionicimonas sp.]